MPDFTTLSVLFFTRKLNRNKKELSIYARITVNGKCAEMSLKRKTSVNEWDNSKGRLKRTSTRINIPNHALVDLILLRGNVQIEEYDEETYKIIAESHQTISLVLIRNMNTVVTE